MPSFLPTPPIKCKAQKKQRVFFQNMQLGGTTWQRHKVSSPPPPEKNGKEDDTFIVKWVHTSPLKGSALLQCYVPSRMFFSAVGLLGEALKTRRLRDVDHIVEDFKLEMFDVIYLAQRNRNSLLVCLIMNIDWDFSRKVDDIGLKHKR